MLSKVLFSAVLLATGVFSTPVHPHVTRALARGIDLNADIPADAVPIPGGGFAFEYKSAAGDWARAQIALGETSSTIGIGMFTVRECGDGRGVWFPNVEYGAKNHDIVPARYWSVGIAGRGLKFNEILKFSQKGRGLDNINDYCANQIDQVIHEPVGCFRVPDINCFVISTTDGPTIQ